MAGALTPIAVPTESAEAARDLARAREQVRGDLMRCRHRLSKLLLRHGRMWDASTWTKAHERWLGSQRFEQVNTELAYIDALAACQGLTARRESLDERLSQVAREAEFWPTVSRLRAFHGSPTNGTRLAAETSGTWRRRPAGRTRCTHGARSPATSPARSRRPGSASHQANAASRGSPGTPRRPGTRTRAPRRSPGGRYRPPVAPPRT